MKKIVLSLLVVSAGILGLQSCTDDFDATNRNPNKIYEAKPDYVFPGIAKKSVDIYSKLNHEMLQTYAQYSICWKEQNDNDANDTYFEGFYVKSLNDLEKCLRAYSDKEGFENQIRMLKTWKAWEYFIMVSSFGGVPMSEACELEVKNTHKYDNEKQCYKQIFEYLDDAADNLDLSGDKFAQDPIYPSNGTGSLSDLVRWKKFANSLRLYVALTIQNMDADLAEQEIKKCFVNGNDQYLISSIDDIAQFQYGTDVNADCSYMYSRVTKEQENGAQPYGGYTYPAMSHNFYLYMKSYDDPRLYKYCQIPEGTNRPTLQNDTITRVNPRWGARKGYRDSIIVNYRILFNPRRQMKALPAGWIVGIDPSSHTGEQYRDPYGNIKASRVDCLVSKDFMKADASYVLLSWADVCFMKAEVAIKYPGVVSGTAKEYYEQGIRASMAQYGVASADVDKYLNEPGVKWDTDGDGLWEYRHFFKADIKGHGNDANHLEQIYKQWYFADFYYGHQGWTLERRTRCMKFPPYFYNNSSPVGGNGVCDWMAERLLYPTVEKAYNLQSYNEAVAELYKSSPEPNSAHDGDNFYTTLCIAAPQNTGLDNWLSGEIKYDGRWLFHPYGKTLEEVYANTGCTTVAELKDKIDFKVNGQAYSIYDPKTGYNVDPKTGQLIIPKDN